MTVPPPRLPGVGWEPAGRVVRLQVQVRRIKLGDKPLRRYDPSGIVAVPALVVDADGVRGLAADGASLDDVHNARHSASRNVRGMNGVSVVTTADYAAMRARFGAHLADGVAGESILVDTGRPLAGAVPAALAVQGEPDVLLLEQLQAAAPCVEFARHCMGREPSAQASPELAAALRDLGDGRRGVYAVAGNGPVTLRVGAQVWLRPAAPVVGAPARS